MKSPTTIETWMPEARQLAAQCWCDEETKDRVMDTVLAEAVARRIAGWMDAAAQAYRDVSFYRGVVVQIGEMFGDEAKTSDDGSIQQDVLALKVPEVVKRYLSEHATEFDTASGISKSMSLSSPKDTGESKESGGQS